jgi:hypothetical protein
MVDDPIPEDVRDYIARHVDSIAQLEALMLLRSKPDESWDLNKIARRLYVSEPEVSHALGFLTDARVVSFRDGAFVYDPAPEVRDMIERLAATYTRHLIPVTNLIHSKPSRIHQFADAFKFRRDR